MTETTATRRRYPRVTVRPEIPERAAESETERRELRAKKETDLGSSGKSSVLQSIVRRDFLPQGFGNLWERGIDGEPYWYYEYLVRKSPTSSVQELNIYRRYVAATAEYVGVVTVEGITYVLEIGPPNSKFIKSVDKNSWDAKDVADCVLSNKSALRVTSAQRLAESFILDTHITKIDGEPYWYYEYLVRKSLLVLFKSRIFTDIMWLQLLSEMGGPGNPYNRVNAPPFNQVGAPLPPPPPPPPPPVAPTLLYPPYIYADVVIVEGITYVLENTANFLME
ncbi:hypothetical protein Scep_030243 [Stephania cephalantha]|uniref:Uncharacterized protein n=1 Tax=Stephania cephalantha TaxID=152367 RepID=A0AAP0HGB5_9MAGN